MSYSLRHLPQLSAGRLYFFDTIWDSVTFFNEATHYWESQGKKRYYGAIYSKDMRKVIFSFKDEKPSVVIQELKEKANELYCLS